MCHISVEIVKINALTDVLNILAFDMQIKGNYFTQTYNSSK